MIVLYCLDPLDRRRPDEAFTREAAVADRLGIPWALIDHDALIETVGCSSSLTAPRCSVRNTGRRASTTASRPRSNGLHGWRRRCRA